MPLETVADKNDRAVIGAVKVLKSPWDDAVRCAFRGKARGEGIIPDDEKLKQYEREMATKSSKIRDDARKKAIKHLFGDSTPFRSIFDYRDSGIPKDPPDAAQKVKLYSEAYAKFKDDALREAIRLNDRRALIPDQARRMTQTQTTFIAAMNKIRHRMAMEATFGKGTPYQRLMDYIPSRGSLERKNASAPADWEVKYKEYEKLEKQFTTQMQKDAMTDPSFEAKVMCLVAANEHHLKTGNLLYTSKYDNHDFVPTTWYGATKEKQLGSAISDAFAVGYPRFSLVPPSDYTETAGGILSMDRTRSEFIASNEDKTRYFKPEIVKNAFEKQNMVVDGDRLPWGWNIVKDTSDAVVITQPIIARHGIDLPSADKMLEVFTKEHTLPVPMAHIEKTGSKWKVTTFDLRKDDTYTYPTRPKAVKASICFATAYNAGTDAIQPDLTAIKKERQSSFDKKPISDVKRAELQKKFATAEAKALTSCLVKEKLA